MLQKLHSFRSMTSFYIVAALLLSAFTYPLRFHSDAVYASSDLLLVKNLETKKQSKNTVSGKPVRIVIKHANIDLPVDEGGYNAASGTWVLGDAHAYYAVKTPLANNISGATFVYGHGTDAVFGKIGTNRPPAGTVAKIYTNNGRVFIYKLHATIDETPDDTSVLVSARSGSPRLIVQTCTGLFSEHRTMFVFSFEKVQTK